MPILVGLQLVMLLMEKLYNNLLLNLEILYNLLHLRHHHRSFLQIHPQLLLNNQLRHLEVVYLPHKR